MTCWWLEICLKSELCAATGGGSAGMIDSKTALEYGIPVIPARRLKGCLLHIAKELNENNIIDLKYLELLFGCQGNEAAGALSIRDAHIYSIPAEILKPSDESGEIQINDYEEFEKELHAQNNIAEAVLEEIFTRTRTRTALEDEGEAAEGTLRTMQTVPRGIRFRAEVEVTETEEEERVQQLLEWSVKGLRHIGVGVTRGFGEVECSLIRREEALGIPKRYALIPEKSGTEAELPFELHLKSPVLLEGESGVYASSVNWIPGSALRGALAGMYRKDHGLLEKAHEEERFRRIFLENGVSFGYAFLKRGERIFHPCPASIARLKYRDQCIDRLVGKAEKERRKEIHSLLCMEGEKFYLAEAKKEVRMHHQRPADRGIGHALHDRGGYQGSDRGQFFQYISLSKGQTFSGSFRGSKDDLRLLAECLEKRNYCLSLGRSKSAEYGQAVLYPLESKKEDRPLGDAKKGKHWFLWFLTPFVLAESGNGEIKPDPEFLAGQIKEQCHCKEVSIQNMILKYTVTGGFNSKWRLPEVQYPALAQGTVLKISTEKEIADFQLEEFRWGRMTGQGFGQLKAIPYEEQEKKTWPCPLVEEALFQKGSKEKASLIWNSLNKYMEEKEKNRQEMQKIMMIQPVLPENTILNLLSDYMAEHHDCTYEKMEHVLQDDDKAKGILEFLKPCQGLQSAAMKLYIERAKWLSREEEASGGKDNAKNR